MIEKRKSPIQGWGVFATAAINKNKRIVTYDGEKIRSRESLKREAKYLEKGHIWCFKLNHLFVRDAGVGGNVARFINHACKPNCYSHIIDGIIWIRAGRTIEAGEELTYHYYTGGTAEIPCQCRPGCKGQI
jgi:SET domain-containing protein